ncbi:MULTISPECIES: efflux transporter outer membrane subunit [unclassified Beijerinckia]|uniref:efflux transporter outer membrane subunit n=1 Tax=unclassified Beijerinckia TaxID=2638183 RepID=UPI000B82B04E|nr:MULTISPECIES: efflux transporter outer membrane subunit [unclassified Beijerinckia]
MRTTKRRRLIRIATIPLMAVGLSGCILNSEHPDPEVEVPVAYETAPRKADAALPAPDWWRGFRSSELTDLVLDAQSANLDIAVAVAQIIQAEAQAGAAGAPLLPTVGGVGNAERIRTPATGGSSASLNSTFSLGLTASYMLDFWGKNRAAFYSASETFIGSRYNRDVVALTTTVSVANAYFQVLAARDQLGVAQENLAAANRILDLIRKQMAGGTASQLQLSQQEALVAQVKASIPPLQVTVKQNLAALAVLLARPTTGFTIKGASLTRIAVPRVTPGLPSELLTRRPDLALAEAQLASSNFSVESARAAFFPQVTLTGTTGFQSGALSSLFVPGAWYYTMAAGLTQPIFNGFLLENQLKQARGLQLQYLQSYRKAVVSAFSDVEVALVTLQQTTLQLQLQGQVVAASRKAFQVAETQLRGGTVDLVSVLQTQQTLFTADTALAQVRLSKMLAVVSLFQALGGGWSEPPTGR